MIFQRGFRTISRVCARKSSAKTLLKTENELLQSWNEGVATKLERPRVAELYDAAHEYIPTMEQNPKDTEWFSNTVINTVNVVPKWLRGIRKAEERRNAISKIEYSEAGPIQLGEIIKQIIKESGFNITVIDTSTKCSHMNYMIICEGRSAKQVYSLADSLKRLAKHRYTPGTFLPMNLSISGKNCDDWMVLDLGQFIIHFFTPEKRAEMNLESFWLLEQ